VTKYRTREKEAELKKIEDGKKKEKELYEI